MTEILAANYLNDAGRTKGQMKQAFEDMLSFIKEIQGGTGKTTIALSSGTLTVTDDYTLIQVNPSSGSSDTMTAIAGAVRDGRLIALCVGSGKTITIQNSGALATKDGADRVINNANVVDVWRYVEGTGWQEYMRDVSLDLAKLPGSKASSELTISTGAIVPAGWQHSVDTESDDAADDLTDLTATNAIPLVMLKAENPARVVTVKTTGNITTLDGKDLVFDSADKRALFVLSGSDYIEIARSGFDILQTWDVVSKTSNFTAEAWKTYLCDTTGGAITATLPAVGNKNAEIEFVKTSSDDNDLIADGASSETINGATTKTISDQWASFRLRDTGSAWVVVAETVSVSSGGGSLFKPAMITETLRTFPTSGSVSGVYVMKDVNWTSTGAITLAGPTFVYANGGSFTLDHAITGTPLGNGGLATTTASTSSYVPGGNGGGLGGGQSSSYTGYDADAGGGGGGGSPAGSDGGNGGSATTYNQGMGGRGYSYLESLTGSGGGSNTAYSSGADAGLPGGGGGTCFIFEGYNCNVDLNESITCAGEDGTDQTEATYNAGPGGGGGGSIQFILGGTSTFDLAAAKALDVSGGDGGNGYSTSGGAGAGGAGGLIRVTTESASLTVNGSLTVSGGAAGTGSEVKPATAGEAGVSDTASSTKPISVR